MKRTCICVCMLSLVAIMVLSACGQKSLDIADIQLKSGGSVISQPIEVAVGTPLTVEVSLPTQDALLSVVPNRQGLSVSQRERVITIEADTPGDYMVTLRIEAKGYDSAEIAVPVLVTSQSMQFSLEQVISVANGQVESAEMSGGLALSRGESVLLLPKLYDAVDDMYIELEEANLQLLVSDDEVALASWQDGLISIEATYPGDAVVTVITADGSSYEAQAMVNISVGATQAALSMWQGDTEIAVDETREFRVTYQRGGRLTFNYDSAGVSLTQSDNAIFIKGLKSGQYRVTVTCEADGYGDSQAVLDIEVTQPKVTIAVVSSLELREGRSRQVEMRVTPSDAEVYLSAHGSVEASLEGNIITVSADAVGDGRVEITAQKNGYAEGKSTLNVTVLPALPSVSTTYAQTASDVIQHMNTERRAEGIHGLSYVPDLEVLAAVRAKEASEFWSHTRPDGREWHTVFDDYQVSRYPTAGENLYTGPSGGGADIVGALMNSPAHKENILRKEFYEVGIGVYYSEGAYFVAQVFRGEQ